ncbi:hypothetical protein EDD85DRAFT_939174 [Armillaria nabsnona]|nr:hypothetical protein EDD85DRAFT_939174 [Armillaria nabsnona]
MTSASSPFPVVGVIRNFSSSLLRLYPADRRQQRGLVQGKESATRGFRATHFRASHQPDLLLRYYHVRDTLLLRFHSLRDLDDKQELLALEHEYQEIELRLSSCKPTARCLLPSVICPPMPCVLVFTAYAYVTSTSILAEQGPHSVHAVLAHVDVEYNAILGDSTAMCRSYRPYFLASSNIQTGPRWEVTCERSTNAFASRHYTSTWQRPLDAPPAHPWCSTWLRAKVGIPRCLKDGIPHRVCSRASPALYSVLLERQREIDSSIAERIFHVILYALRRHLKGISFETPCSFFTEVFAKGASTLADKWDQCFGVEFDSPGCPDALLPSDGFYLFHPATFSMHALGLSDGELWLQSNVFCVVFVNIHESAQTDAITSYATDPANYGRNPASRRRYGTCDREGELSHHPENYHGDKHYLRVEKNWHTNPDLARKEADDERRLLLPPQASDLSAYGSGSLRLYLGMRETVRHEILLDEDAVLYVKNGSGKSETTRNAPSWSFRLCYVYSVEVSNSTRSVVAAATENKCSRRRRTLHAERLGNVAKTRYDEVERPPSLIRSVGIFALHDADTGIHHPAVVARIWIVFEHSKEKMANRLLTGEELRVPFVQIRDQPALFPRPSNGRDVDRRVVSYDARMSARDGGGSRVMLKNGLEYISWSDLAKALLRGSVYPDKI